MAGPRKLGVLAEATRRRFLAATEQLFAAHGYDGTSMRAIARKADVNLATVAHYWGTKRALFRDLFERRFRALAEEHVRRFKALAAGVAKGRALELREVLLALIEPAFLVSAAQAAHLGNAKKAQADRKLFHCVYGRALTDPSDEVADSMNEIFAEMIPLFLRLLRKCCAHLEPQEFYWRVICVTGAHVFAQASTPRIGKFLTHELDDLDDPLAAERIVSFLLPGMEAPAVSAARRKRASA